MAIAIMARLQPWLDRVDNLELRERILLLATTVTVMFLLADTLILQPTLKAQQVSQQQILELGVKLNSLQQNAQLLSYTSATDPVISRRMSRDQLVLKLAGLDTRIASQLGTLVEPVQAAEVLERLLSAHSGLKLTSLNATTKPLKGMDREQQTETPGLVRYQLDLVVQGSYLDLLTYLQSLKDMPGKFFWQQVDFQATQYPHAETRLKLFTLIKYHDVDRAETTPEDGLLRDPTHPQQEQLQSITETG